MLFLTGVSGRAIEYGIMVLLLKVTLLRYRQKNLLSMEILFFASKFHDLRTSDATDTYLNGKSWKDSVPSDCHAI
jgi:hypothetical protein